MRAKDVICKDLMMNSVKRLQNRQLPHAESLFVYDDEFGTDDLVQNLLLDGTLHFFAKRELMDVSQNPEFSLRLLKGNPPDKVVNLSLDISSSINGDELSLFFTEKIDGFPPFNAGRTRIIRNLKEPFEGHRAKGAIVIDPGIRGDARFCSVEADCIVPVVSLGFGGYILVTMDGDWEKIKEVARMERAKDHLLEDGDLKEKIYAFLEDMKGMKEDLHNSARADKKLADRLRTAEEEVERLQSSISGFRKDISEEKKKNIRLAAERDELSQKVAVLKKKLRKAHDFAERAARTVHPCRFVLSEDEPDDVQEAETSDSEPAGLSVFDGKAVYIIGGREDWVSRAEDYFPSSWHFLGNRKNFDGSGLKNADFLLVNINSTAHCVVARAKRLATRAKVITSTARNVEVFARDVAESARG